MLIRILVEASNIERSFAESEFNSLGPNRLNTEGNTTGKEDSEKTYGCGTFYHFVFRKQLAILSVF